MADDSPPWAVTHQWMRSPCSCHRQLLMSRSVSYHLTHRCLAARQNQSSILCFASSSNKTEELPRGVYCSGGDWCENNGRESRNRVTRLCTAPPVTATDELLSVIRLGIDTAYNFSCLTRPDSCSFTSCSCTCHSFIHFLSLSP